MLVGALVLSLALRTGTAGLTQRMLACIHGAAKQVSRARARAGEGPRPRLDGLRGCAYAQLPGTPRTLSTVYGMPCWRHTPCSGGASGVDPPSPSRSCERRARSERARACSGPGTTTLRAQHTRKDTPAHLLSARPPQPRAMPATVLSVRQRCPSSLQLYNLMGTRAPTRCKSRTRAIA